MSIINCFSSSKGLDIDGIVNSYYVYAGEKVSAGDFVEFINGLPNQVTDSTYFSPSTSLGTFSPRCISATLINTNKFLVAYGVYDTDAGTGYCKGCAKIGTVSGDTIVFGSEYIFKPVGNGTGMGDYVSVDSLSGSNRCVIAYTKSGNGAIYTIIGTISDTTISFGAAVEVQEVTNITNPTIIDVSTTNAVLIYNRGSNDYNATFSYISINGTTITSTTSSWNPGDGGGWPYISMCKISSTMFLISGCGQNVGASKASAKCCVITLSGSTISYGTVYSFFNGSTIGSKVCPAVSNSTVTKFFITFIDSDNNYSGKALICTRSGSTLTFYNTYTFYDTNKGIYDNQCMSVLNFSTTEVIVAYTTTSRSSRTAMHINVQVATISTNNEISFTLPLEIGVRAAASNWNYPRLVKTTNSSFLLAYSHLGGIARIYSYSSSNKNQVRKTTTSQFIGIAKTKGTGGSQVKVYVPDI